MSYGFTATNDYNQTLISSSTKNLHFIGKAYLYDTLLAGDSYGGVRQWRYRIGTSQSIVPLPFFTMTGSEYYGISAVRKPDTSASIIITTQPIPIQGQAAKSYRWTSNPNSINEGIVNTYTINTTNVATGTVLYWDISSSTNNDFEYTDGSFLIDAAGNGVFQITPTKYFDPYPENAENYTVNIRTYTALTGTIVLSQTFTVNNQTSSDITGFGWISDANWGPSTFSEGSNMPGTGTPAGTTFIVSAIQGNNSVIVTSDPIIITSQYEESYTYTENYYPISEGTTRRVYVSTSNVRAGTVIYWTLNSTNINNFVTDTGNFTIDGAGNGFFDITPTLYNDPYPETYSDSFTIYLQKKYGPADNLTIEYLGTTNNPTFQVINVNSTQTTYFGWYNNALWGTDPISEGVVGSGIPSDDNSIYSSVPRNVFIVSDKNPNNPVLATSPTMTIVNGYVTVNASFVTRGATWSYYAQASDITAAGYTAGDITSYQNTYGIILVEGNYLTMNISGASQILPDGQVLYWDVEALGTGFPKISQSVYLDGLASDEAQTNDFSIRSGSLTIYGNAATFDLPSITFNETFKKEVLYENFRLNIRIGAELTGVIIKQVPFQVKDNRDTGSGSRNTIEAAWPQWGDPDDSFTKTFTANINKGTTTKFYLWNGAKGNNSNSNATYFWVIEHITTTAANFTATSGEINLFKTNSSSGFTAFKTGIFEVVTVAESSASGFKKFRLLIKLGSTSGTLVKTSGEIRLLDVSAAVGTPPSLLSTTHPNNIINEATTTYANITVSYTLTLASILNASDSTKVYWKINHISTNDLDFAATFGYTTVAANSKTAYFNIVVKYSTPTDIEGTEYFTVSVVGLAADYYRYWSIVNITTNGSNDFVTTSGVCIPGGYNWWYFTVNAKADSTTEGTETFRLNITNSSNTVLVTSGEIAIIDTSQTSRVIPYIIGPSAVAEGVSNNYTVYTSGLADGTYYWRINDITTSTVPNVYPNLATGDFTTSWGEFNINSNRGTFYIAAASDGFAEFDETFSISVVNKAAADKYWSIQNITTQASDFNATTGRLIPGGYNYWYFNIPVIADSQTEGTEKFKVEIRQDGSNALLTTSGAISIFDTSLGNYATIPSVGIEGFTFNITIFTPGVSPGTTLYWDINHITTSDQDFNVLFGSFTASSTGAIISILPINYDAVELDENFTINVRTQPKYVWEIELIRSGTSNTVPEVYVFAEAQAASLSPTDTFGLKVINDDGTTSFDSRLGPLVLAGGITAIPPTIAAPSWSGGESLTNASCNFDPGAQAAPTNFNSYNVGALPAKPIYFYPSIAQSEKEVLWRGNWTYYFSCVGNPFFGYACGNSTYSERYGWSWAFYRSGISRSGNYINAGWVTTDHGCYYRTDETLRGAGTVIGGGGYAGGSWPYSNETLNLNSGVCLISDGALYD